MKLENYELQVGDVLFKSTYGKLSKVKVERVTKKLAVLTGGYRVYRECKESWVREYGGNIWTNTSYNIFSDSLNDKYLLQKLQDEANSLMDRLVMKNLTKEELIAFITMFQNPNPLNKTK